MVLGLSKGSWRRLSSSPRRPGRRGAVHWPAHRVRVLGAANSWRRKEVEVGWACCGQLGLSAQYAFFFYPFLFCFQFLFSIYSSQQLNFVVDEFFCINQLLCYRASHIFSQYLELRTFNFGFNRSSLSLLGFNLLNQNRLLLIYSYDTEFQESRKISLKIFGKLPFYGILNLNLK